MSGTRAEVEALVERVDTTPRAQQAPLAEELARAADALGEEDLRFRSRLRLVRAYNQTTDRSRVLAPFGFLLQRYDAAPDWMTRNDRFHVLWFYKWMVSVLVEHPQVPLERLQEALDGMRRRYTEAGEGLAPVLMCAYLLAAHVHGPDGAEDEYDAWVGAPRIFLSDCRACEPSTRIRHLAAVGRHDLAVAELGPVVDGTTTCPDQPEWAVSEALASLLAVGEAERAASLHLRSVRVSRRSPAALGNLARHLHLLARTGNLAHGLDLLAERLGDLDRPPTPLAGLSFDAAATRLLAAVVAAGEGGTLVRARGRDPVRAEDLLPRVRERALGTAELFDERNGTSTTSDRIRAWMEAAELGPMPLGRRPDAAVTVPHPGDLDLPHVASHPELPAPERFPELDAVALHRAGELAARYAHRPAWDLLGAHWRQRRGAEVARASATGADPALVGAVAALDDLVARTAREADPALVGSAARLHRLHGDEASALLLEEHGRARAGEPLDAAALLAAVDATGTPGQRARARWWVATELGGAGAHRCRREGLDLLDRVGPDLDPAERLTRAGLLLVPDGTQDPDRAAAARQEVLTLLRPGEQPALRVGVQLDLAAERTWSGDVPGALAALDEAEATGRRAGAPELVLQALRARAQVLAGAGRAPEAERLLTAAAAGSDAEQDPDGAAEARAALGDLLRRQGRSAEAIEAVETALAADPAGRPARSRAHARHRAGVRVRLLDLGSRLSEDLGQQARAQSLARAAVAVATGVDDPPGPAAAALLRLAELLGGTDPVEATGLFGRALEQAERAGRPDLALVVRRERVPARLAADGPDAALADLDDAVAANRTLEQEALTDRATRERLGHWDFGAEQLSLAMSRARVLSRSERPTEALAALDGVPGRLRAAGAEASALEAEVLRAQLLLDTGREDEGLRLLDDVAVRAGAIGAAGLVRVAASTGARWLDARGRPEESQRLWERHLPARDRRDGDG